ncbi:uncharacterized protein LOC105736523 [Apis florea]|uniref:uncharacterized protein LOC105736523 n=1 Tax=Apis florea TaxID=7463 RepID=UPI0012FEABD3|nr:uncharacterized protein LOC105736523 [Apis florea]
MLRPDIPDPGTDRQIHVRAHANGQKRIRHQSTGCNTELSLRASIVLRGCILQRHSRDHTEGLWSRAGGLFDGDSDKVSSGPAHSPSFPFLPPNVPLQGTACRPGL